MGQNISSLANDDVLVNQCLSTIHKADDNIQRHRFRQPRSLRKQRHQQSYKNFFIEYQKRRCDNSSEFHDNQQNYSLKRAVFISLIGLHQSWKNAPIYVLFNCICILPIKSQWIIHSNKAFNAQNRTKSIHPTDICSEILQDKEFVNFVRFKHEQGLLVCTENYRERSYLELHYKASSMWHDLSKKLTQLYDPSNSGSNYNAIHLDHNYWKYQSNLHGMSSLNALNNNQVFNEFGSPSCFEILTEINELKMSFRAMKHILEESNPSLNVFVFGYTCCSINGNTNTNTTNGNTSIEETSSSSVASVDDDILDGNWWVSDDYYCN